LREELSQRVFGNVAMMKIFGVRGAR